MDRFVAYLADIVVACRDVTPKIRMMIVKPIHNRCPFFPIFVHGIAHKGCRVGNRPLYGHYVIGAFSSGIPGIADIKCESFGIDHSFTFIAVAACRMDERVFAAPLVIQPAGCGLCAIGSDRSEVSIHEHGPGNIGLCCRCRVVIHGPDMPRPNAIICNVEQSYHGVSPHGPRRERDTAVCKHYIFDNFAIRFPKHTSGNPVKI